MNKDVKNVSLGVRCKWTRDEQNMNKYVHVHLTPRMFGEKCELL